MANRLDIIIFGASGFTGKRTIPHLINLIKSENLSLTWGVAGRSENKLKDVLIEMGNKTGEDLNNIPITCADVNNMESIENMTGQAKMIINTVGPYIFLGEIVIQACVKTGTHHVDVSGEPAYLETIQLKYHQAAIEKGIYLIGACGFDSIPADLGAIFLQRNFQGTINSIDTYLSVTHDGGPYSGAAIHYTTYESAIYGVASHYNDLKGIRSKLYPQGLSEFQSRSKLKVLAFRSSLLNKWSTIFPGTDRSVMMRTQRYMYETYNQRPAYIRCYCCYSSFLNFLTLIIMTGFFVLMCQFNFTRTLLLKYPEFFTCGTVSHEGPSDEYQESTHFHVVLFGEGWSEKLTEASGKFATPPNKIVLAKVSGKNPGYGATCIALALSAILVLTEKDKMPNDGGCYPPGAAFANTSMIEKLNKHGVKFELNPEI